MGSPPRELAERYELSRWIAAADIAMHAAMKSLLKARCILGETPGKGWLRADSALGQALAASKNIDWLRDRYVRELSTLIAEDEVDE